MFHWLMRYIVLGPLLRRRVPAEIFGLENLPKSGGYTLAIGSHKTEVESGVLAVWLRRKILYFFAKAEYWQKNHLLSWFMTAIGQIPIDRSDALKSDEAMTLGATLLRRGKTLSVYPEGTRSPDDRLHGGHPSFVNATIRAGGELPIVPVGLKGFEVVSPNGSGLWPKHTARVEIHIGKPIYLTSIEQAAARKLNAAIAKHPDRSPEAIRRMRVVVEGPIARRVSARVMTAIAELSGKEYVSKRLEIPKH